MARHLETTHKGWVAEHEGQIVAFGMSDRSNGEVWVVAVLPDYEGRGIGRRLVEFAQNWLRQQGHDDIWLWTSRTPPHAPTNSTAPWAGAIVASPLASSSY